MVRIFDVTCVDGRKFTVDEIDLIKILDRDPQRLVGCDIVEVFPPTVSIAFWSPDRQQAGEGDLVNLTGLAINNGTIRGKFRYTVIFKNPTLKDISTNFELNAGEQKQIRVSLFMPNTGLSVILNVGTVETEKGFVIQDQKILSVSLKISVPSELPAGCYVPTDLFKTCRPGDERRTIDGIVVCCPPDVPDLPDPPEPPDSPPPEILGLSTSSGIAQAGEKSKITIKVINSADRSAFGTNVSVEYTVFLKFSVPVAVAGISGKHDSIFWKVNLSPGGGLIKTNIKALEATITIPEGVERLDVMAHAGITLNNQFILMDEESLSIDIRVPPVTATNDLIINFLKVPLISSKDRAESIISTILGIVNPFILKLGFIHISTELDWLGSRFHVYYRKTGSPAPPLLPILLALAIISTVLVISVKWIDKGKVEAQVDLEREKTRSRALAICEEKFDAKEITFDQFEECKKSINEAINDAYDKTDDGGPLDKIQNLLLIGIGGAIVVSLLPTLLKMAKK